MAEKKKTPFKKSAKPAAKTPLKVLSDKEKVKSIFDDAACIEIKNGFSVICETSLNSDLDRVGKPLHSGIAKSESDAWKLAAHNL